METTLIAQEKLTLKGACVAFMFAYQNHDIEKMMQLCDTDGEVWFKPLGESGRGKIGELGKGIWSALLDCFPDLDNTVEAAISEQDDHVRCQVVITGTQAKDFADIPSKGLHFGSDHIFIFRLNPAGDINQIHIEWNHADLKRQLGAA